LLGLPEGRPRISKTALNETQGGLYYCRTRRYDPGIASDLPRFVTIRITLEWEIDLTLRTFLGAQGMKKGDLSKFIEEAVRWRILERP
jgi:hypothetical protein